MTPPPVCHEGAIGDKSQGASFILRAREEVLNLEHPPRRTLGPRKRVSINQPPMSDSISQLGPLLCLCSVPSSTQSQKSHWWPSEGVEEKDKPMVGKETRGRLCSSILHNRCPVCNRLELRGGRSYDLELSFKVDSHPGLDIFITKTRLMVTRLRKDFYYLRVAGGKMRPVGLPWWCSG